MGKNQRHKKVLKSEKSKVKLKAKADKTKFLPKGANVTDTNFKIKPIVLPKQLKAVNPDDIVTKRKLNFKDLLTRLNHHNVSTRYESCEGLLELTHSCQQEILEQYVHVLLIGVCKLILDREKKVRHIAVKVVYSILEKVDSERVVPFFDILTSYATCVMTHIDKSIQEDSLLLIDAFLKHTPILIVKAFDKILSNFLTLISKLRSDSSLSRSLTVNLGSKMTSIRWRINVLTRLQGILETVEKEKKSSANETSNCVIVTVEEAGNTLPIYKGVPHSPLNVFGHSLVTSTNADDNIEQYARVLVPLLYETWAEVVPLSDVKDLADKGATIIEQEAASVLSCVTSIFYLLWNLNKLSGVTMRAIFLSKDNQKFFNHIMNQFPYRQRDNQKQKSKNELNQLVELNSNPKCIKENLLICYMFAVLYKTFPNHHHQNKALGILAYINACLTNRNYITSEHSKPLVVTLRVLLFDNSSTWIQKGVGIQELLENVVHFYKNTKMGADSRTEIFNLLCDVIHLPQLCRSHKYSVWLSSLPALLCKPEISERDIDTLSLLSRQNNTLFLEGLLNELQSILDNLPFIKANGNNLYPLHLKIVSMFFYIPKISSEHMEIFNKFMQNNEGSKVAHYVNEMLQQRLQYEFLLKS